MTVHGPWIADALNTYLSGDTIKALAITPAQTVNPDLEFRSTITGEVSGGGYVAGGVVVTGLTVVYSASRVVIDCDVIDFGTITAPSVAGVALYISTGSAAADRMLATATFEPIEVNGVFTYDPSAEGFLQVTFP